jgi:hypothetical protein
MAFGKIHYQGKEEGYTQPSQILIFDCFRDSTGDRTQRDAQNDLFLSRTLIALVSICHLFLTS